MDHGTAIKQALPQQGWISLNSRFPEIPGYEQVGVRPLDFYAADQGFVKRMVMSLAELEDNTGFMPSGVSTSG